MSDDNKVNNSNLEFRKIKSLGFKYEVNSNGTILRNIKSKKQSKIFLDKDTGYYKTIINEKEILIKDILKECFPKNNGKRPVYLYNRNTNTKYYFETITSCSKFIEETTGIKQSKARNRLKDNRKHIGPYDIIFLNAETIHDSSKEQEIVHLLLNLSDLTGDYKTAFNKGKQDEVEHRFRHSSLMEV